MSKLRYRVSLAGGGFTAAAGIGGLTANREQRWTAIIDARDALASVGIAVRFSVNIPPADPDVITALFTRWLAASEALDHNAAADLLETLRKNGIVVKPTMDAFRAA